MRNLISLSLLVLLSGCATKQKIMDVAMVSMTRYNLPPNAHLKQLGDVTGQYCADRWHDKGSIGLFDQAITIAQKQSGADFISNASFFREGSCVTVEGTGEKMYAGRAAPAKAPQK